MAGSALIGEISFRDRSNELDNLVKKLYEAFATGKLNDKHFNRLMAEYDSEQSELEQSVKSLQKNIEDFDSKKLKTNEFIKLVDRYTDFSEITTPMLNEFVEKTVVYEAGKFSGERHVRVDIHFNFIGHFVIAGEEYDPAKIKIEAEQRQAERKELEKEKARIRAREYHKRKKEEEPLAV